jgi:hypothetical protein
VVGLEGNAVRELRKGEGSIRYGVGRDLQSGGGLMIVCAAFQTNLGRSWVVLHGFTCSWRALSTFLTCRSLHNSL